MRNVAYRFAQLIVVKKREREKSKYTSSWEKPNRLCSKIFLMNSLQNSVFY